MMPTRGRRAPVLGDDRGVRLIPPTADDVPFLWQMLAEAARVEVLEGDHLTRYLDGWGPGSGSDSGSADAGLVAWDGGERLGAAWTRLLPADRPGYGFVDPATPELSVAVIEAARGRGVGRALVTGTLDQAAAHGHERVSLSVALDNPVAAGLYRSLGFVDVAPDDGGSMTMVAPTAPAAPPAGRAPVLAGRLATAVDGPAVARLRRVMFGGFGDEGGDGWADPLLALWPVEHDAGRWVGAVVDGPDGRPVASALAVVQLSPPGPGREPGRAAHVGSVATEPAWRPRGAARAAVTTLLAALDERGVESSTLSASPAGADLYLEVGYRPGNGVAMRRPRGTA